jgi:beta-lactamase regulating signal transducer with metallopeptidase domain
MAAPGVIEALGWALIHFIWQGVVVAGLAALVLHLLRGGSAQVRYAVACCALAGMLALPVLTGIAVHTSSGGRSAARAESIGAGRVAAGPQTLSEALRSAAPATLTARRAEPAEAANAGSGSQRLLFGVVAAWLMGVFLLSLRTFVGLVAVRRLARTGREVTAYWQQRLGTLRARLSITTPVRLLESSAAAVPMVIGWLRPVILLPPAVLTGLTPQQIEAILLHELAHVRRHDHLVNLVQIAVETLLFYNPAVWWLSGRIREEREHCCDDVAAAALGSPLPYAQSLLHLEELRRPPALAMAATGGSLLQRVRRLMAPPPPPRVGAYWMAALLLALSLGTAAALHAYASDAALAGNASSPPAATSPAVFVVVEAGAAGIEQPHVLAAALEPFAVSAVYTTSERRTLEAARPLADLLDVGRIPYDFADDPERFAAHLVGGSFMANLGRVAVLVLPGDAIPAFIEYASRGLIADAALGPGEIFLVEIPGTATRVRVQ